MDVNVTSFEALLPRLLNDTAECQFVSLDMEFSGIASKNGDKKGRMDERTMQARYREVKEAAEKYQVLQIGMTFVKEDRKTGLLGLALPLSPMCVHHVALVLFRQLTLLSF